MKFITPLLVLLASSVANANNIIPNLRGNAAGGGDQDIRALVADAILVAIHDPEGLVESSTLLKLNRMGVPAELLHQLAREANRKIHVQGIPIHQVEADIQKWRDGALDKVAAKEAAAPEKKEVQQLNPNVRTNGYTTNHAIVALSKAVLSGFRSIKGEMDPKLVKEALDLGATEDQIARALEKIQSKRPKPQSLTPKPASTITIEKTAADEQSSRFLKAVTRAALSGYHSPTGVVDPKLMEEAIQLGGTRDRVLQSIEFMKKGTFTMSQEQQPQNSLGADAIEQNTVTATPPQQPKQENFWADSA
eukprot:CAMPEP_0194200932 /NCGR_PEP_ID=MMETSP0156-20130528/1356_1 /TAXON_ID=33649 /ORGANISM="Thalassionema nitzschioides, Strain L26-B" /LENGTH=305 /DNA_ID=CAMNT_0038926007 /DNA_START=40 /DNA_END=957 /DNA_ORIENTATION=+